MVKELWILLIRNPSTCVLPQNIIGQFFKRYITCNKYVIEVVLCSLNELKSDDPLGPSGLKRIHIKKSSSEINSHVPGHVEM